MIRVVLVDDQTLVRSGIRGLLELTEDIAVIGEAGNGADAVKMIAGLRPDIVLLDVRMSDCSGIEVLGLLSERDCLPPTILLTTFDDDDALLEGIRGGARGFLLKDISLERLAEGIRQVHSGLSLIRPAMTERVAQGVRESATAFDKLDMPDRLTNREAEILRLMAGGFSNREIADLLGSSEGTVKNHISSILSKLGVRDRVRAVLRGIELGYV